MYGDGTFAKELTEFLGQQGVEVIGKITSTGFQIGQTKGGKELYEENQYTVFMGVFNHIDDPVEILNFLEEINVVEIITPSSAIQMFKDSNFSKYYLDGLKTGSNSEFEVSEVASFLSDEESCLVLGGFIEYQSTGNLRALRRSGAARLQYLGLTLPQPFKELWMEGNLYWIDVGAFDGDTLRAIRDSGRNMKKDQFICIEPDSISFGKLTQTCAELDLRSKNLNVAIGEELGVIRFNHEGKLSAHKVWVSEDEKSVGLVEMRTIDSICQAIRPTHIKMDIEGSEMDALHGATYTLQKYRPKLAISVYHLPQDITKIPLYLMNLLPNYDWFIRCYGAHGYDTILYGIPRLKR